MFWPLEGVADARRFTGEPTVELFVGVEIVTDGLMASTLRLSV